MGEHLDYRLFDDVNRGILCRMFSNLASRRKFLHGSRRRIGAARYGYKATSAKQLSEMLEICRDPTKRSQLISGFCRRGTNAWRDK